MTAPSGLDDSIRRAWATNARATEFLVERIPESVWSAAIPGYPRKSIQVLAAHLHNARSRWIKTLGVPHGIARPPLVDQRLVSRAALVRALRRSERAMAELLDLALERGGAIPPTKAYVWRNLPLDVGHVLAYFVAHEGHHRGQIVMIARQLGRPLPPEAIDGIWQFTRLSKRER